jgi:hypothetical protein
MFLAARFSTPGTQTASRIAADPQMAATAVAQVVAGLDVARAANVLAEAAASFHRLALAAEREATQQARLAARPAVTVAVPHVERDVTDLAALVALGGALWGSATPAKARSATGRSRRSDTRG